MTDWRFTISFSSNHVRNQDTPYSAMDDITQRIMDAVTDILYAGHAGVTFRPTVRYQLTEDAIVGVRNPHGTVPALAIRRNATEPKE